MTEFDFEDEITRMLRAGTRGLALLGRDELAALQMLESVGRKLPAPVHTWSAASGIDGDGQQRSLGEVVERIAKTTSPALWLLLGAAGPSFPARELRRLRELVQRRCSGSTVVLIDPPSERLRTMLDAVPEIEVRHLPLPRTDQLENLVRGVGKELEREGIRDARACLDSHARAISRACVGLEAFEVDRILREAVWSRGPDAAAVVGFIHEQKAARLDRDGLLEVVEEAPEEDLGGLAQLKSWLVRRALALEPEARAAAIPAPRGLMLLGVPGCGKSLAARVCASVMGVPLLRLDPGRLFGGTVGESEANLRAVTATAERMAPIVLWLDEVDKGLAGSDGAASDAGTTARVVGGLLTWLQEQRREVFVVATANGIERLPPELLRRGRLDELFFVDLPDADEREAILHIHLERKPARLLGAPPPMGSPVSSFAALARAADGFSGAELEAAIVEARLDAYARRESVDASDFERALAATIPLSRSHAEPLAALRRWARDRARKA